MASAAVLVALALLGCAHAAPSKLPAGLRVCPRNDPGLNACLKSAITDAFSVVADGLPTLSISTIDPLPIKRLEIGEGSGPVKVNLDFHDINLLGLKDAWIETIKVNLDDFKIEGRVRFNGPIRIQGPYKISGSVLVLPIVGDGVSNITLNNLIADIDVVGDHFTKGGEDFIKINNFGLKLTVNHLNLHFTNLFNGEKALGESMNKFLNDNWEEIFRELQPAFEMTLGATFQSIAAQFFRKVPFDQIFPKA